MSCWAGDEAGWAVANGVVMPPDAGDTDTGAPGTETPGAEAVTSGPGAKAPDAETVTKETRAATVDPGAAADESGLAVCTLGEDGWGWSGARSVADAVSATLVLDFRDSLVAAQRYVAQPA